jgi:hypothetical protein
MSDPNESEVLHIEMEVQLPDILDGPVERADGVVFKVGDTVRHQQFGIGKVVRICQYQTIGVGLYIDFDSGEDEILSIDFLEKVNNSNLA